MTESAVGILKHCSHLQNLQICKNFHDFLCESWSVYTDRQTERQTDRERSERGREREREREEKKDGGVGMMARETKKKA